jgi:hypothetical protein
MTSSFSSFKTWAEVLKREDNIDYTEKGNAVIDTMATRYVEAKDAGDEHNKNKYIAGLMLRFWHKVSKLQAKCVGINLSYDDYIAWLYEAIEYACKYRAWLNPDKKVNAQQAINQCIETIRLQHYYEFNLDKHRANYNSVSFDAPIDENGSTTVGDTLSDEYTPEGCVARESSLATRSLIQTYINRKKLVEAIILDTIAFNDVNKVTKKVVKGVDSEGNPIKYTQVYSEFWPYRCVQLLGNLPSDYDKYFAKAYNINQVEFSVALATVRAASNQKLYKYLDKTLISAREVFAK